MGQGRAYPEMAKKLGDYEWQEARFSRGGSLPQWKWEGKWVGILEFVSFRRDRSPRLIRRGELLVPKKNADGRRTVAELFDYHNKYTRRRTGEPLWAFEDQSPEELEYLEDSGNPHITYFEDVALPISPEVLAERYFAVTAESVDYAIEEWAIRWNLLEPRVGSRHPKYAFASRGENPRPHDPEGTAEGAPADGIVWKYYQRPTWASFFVTWVVPVAWATLEKWQADSLGTSALHEEPCWDLTPPHTLSWHYPDLLPGSGEDTMIHDGLRAIVLSTAAEVLGFSFDEERYWADVMKQQDAKMFGGEIPPLGRELEELADLVGDALWNFTAQRKAAARARLKTSSLVRAKNANVTQLMSKLEKACKPFVENSGRPHRSGQTESEFFTYARLVRHQVLGQSAEFIARNDPDPGNRSQKSGRKSARHTGRSLKKAANTIRASISGVGRKMIGTAWDFWKLKLPVGPKRLPRPAC